MALNPIVYTERIVRSFLCYQLTAYPFAGERLHAQARRLLSLDVTCPQSSLLKAGYNVAYYHVGENKSAVGDLCRDACLHEAHREARARATAAGTPD